MKTDENCLQVVCLEHETMCTVQLSGKQMHCKGLLSVEIKFVFHAVTTDLMAIPGRVTSQLQLVHVVPYIHFKDHLKQLNSQCFLASSFVLTPTRKVKKPSVVLVYHWVGTSWQWISPEVTDKVLHIQHSVGKDERVLNVTAAMK
jgi:hypothetical protein